MTLEIDPNTPKGHAQIEAIGWAQDQINAILEQYFANNWKIQRGFKVEFRLRLDLQLNEKIKVDLSYIEPKTEEEFDAAVTQAKEHAFPRQAIGTPNPKDAGKPPTVDLVNEIKKGK